MTGSNSSEVTSNQEGGIDRGETVRFCRRTDAANVPRPALEMLLANSSSACPQETIVSSMAKTEVECFDAMSLGWIVPAPDNLSDDIEPDQQRSTDTDARATTDDDYATVDTGWTLSDTDSEYIVVEPLNHVTQAADVYPTVVSSGDRITVRLPDSNPGAVDPGGPLCQLLPLTEESEIFSCSIGMLDGDDLLTVNRGDDWTESRKAEYVRDRKADHHFSTHHTDGNPTE